MRNRNGFFAIVAGGLFAACWAAYLMIDGCLLVWDRIRGRK